VVDLGGKEFATEAQRSFSRSQMDGWNKGFNQPAKLADRVVAPGDGPAEPGEHNPKRIRATKCATDGWKMNEPRVIIITFTDLLN
jgi:hypothetical protein